MDIVNRQLESEYGRLFFALNKIPLSLLFRLTSNVACAGFVVDHVREEEHVTERLERVTDEPTIGPQHFWLSGYNTRTLAILKDCVWRCILLIELCRSTLSRINEVMFPTGPQPQGINGLLAIFRGVGPI